MRQALSHTPMPAWQADGLIEHYAHNHRGKAAIMTSGLLVASGAASRSFAAFARNVAVAFS